VVLGLIEAEEVAEEVLLPRGWRRGGPTPV